MEETPQKGINFEKRLDEECELLRIKANDDSSSFSSPS
jgi:hypothetical protein